ncbi:MAG: T9SS type A sorting domain-containing protein [Bacteroidia bacterium]|nr:T9SS type A sorting domain-containing protein [Bacteroidia bacterium]
MLSFSPFNKLLFLFTLLFSFTFRSAQLNAQSFCHDYGASLQEEARDMVETTDGGVAITGFVVPEESSTGLPSLYVLKLDVNGAIQWSNMVSFKDVEGQNEFGSVGMGIVQDFNGDLVVAGFTTVDPTAFDVLDGLVTKLNVTTGAVINSLIIREPNGQKTGFNAIANFNGSFGGVNGGYYVAGRRNFPGRARDMYLVQLNPSFSINWEGSCGGLNSDEALGVICTNTNSALMVGSTNSFGAVGLDVYVGGFSSVGTFLGDRRFGTTGNDIGQDIVQTVSGFVGVGSSDVSGSNQDLVFRLNAGLTLTNDMVIGNAGEQNSAFRIMKRSGNGFLVSGETLEPGSVDKHLHSIFLTNAGAFSSAKKFDHPDFLKGGFVNELTNTQAVVAGTSFFDPAKTDIFLTKLDLLGNSCCEIPWTPALTIDVMLPETTATIPDVPVSVPRPHTKSGTDIAKLEVLCPQASGKKAEPTQELLTESLQVWPNPAHGQLNVELPVAATLYLNDLTGRTLQTWQAMEGTHILDLGQHPAGIYLLRIDSPTLKKAIKIVIE